MAGFKKFYNARRVLIGVELLQELNKGQYRVPRGLSGRWIPSGTMPDSYTENCSETLDSGGPGRRWLTMLTVGSNSSDQGGGCATHIPWRRSVLATVQLFFLVFANRGFAQPTPPLKFFKNYMVTGDYVTGAVGLRGSGDATGFATGTIRIPDQNATVPVAVPSDADVVAAFLYWQTVEKSQSAFAGQNGFFNGQAIVGTVLGNPNAPVAWSAGGCSGNSKGATTLRSYRADIKAFLNITNGIVQANGSYEVRLADSGSNGGGAPLTLGATLVLIYRVASRTAPLGSVVLYDGAYAPSNSVSTMNLTMEGFYQVAASPVAKVTHIVGNGQPNKFEQVFLNNQILPSPYAGLPPFPGKYNGSWDTVTWLPNNHGNLVNADDSSAAVSVLPSPSNSGCVSWTAVLGYFNIQNTMQDGLVDRWKVGQGYIDYSNGEFVSLPGASVSRKDLFIQMDWFATHDYIMSGGTQGHTHKPKEASLNLVGDMFAAHQIQVHIDCGGCYPGNKYVIAGGRGGNVIDESDATCQDKPLATPPFYCQFPGVAVTGWKGGLTLLKNKNNPANNNKLFQHGRKDSYHYVLFGHALGLASKMWAISDGTLSSIVTDSSSATITTNVAHGLSSGARITVSGAKSPIPVFGKNFTLNTTYPSITVTSPTTFKFPLLRNDVPRGTYSNPGLIISNGPARTYSGWSDVRGADSIVSLGFWPSDSAAENQVGSVLSVAGTLAHELGHTIGLLHGGGDNINCKPNFQSIMNYSFQIRGLRDFNGGAHIDYSNQQELPPLNEANLSESAGIGATFTYRTNWYAPAGFLDKVLNTVGGRAAARHCDGSPIGDGVQLVRVEAPDSAGSTAVDWNNDGVANASGFAQDVNFNGNFFNSPPGNNVEAPFVGFNDWKNIDLRQIGARRGVLGFSGDVWATADGGSGGSFDAGGGGSFDLGGGGSFDLAGGGSFDLAGGGSFDLAGGGAELDFNTANATVDPPVNLTATLVDRKVELRWQPPAFGQIRNYYVWRADITKAGMSSTNPPVKIGGPSGTPPATTFTDSAVKNNTTYQYFVTAALGPDSGPNNGNQSGASVAVTVLVKF